MAVESIHFGRQALLNKGQTSFSGHFFVGGYKVRGGYRGLAGFGFSVQKAALFMSGVGVSFSYMGESSLDSWLIALNTQKVLLRERSKMLMLQIAISHQNEIKKFGDSYSFSDNRAFYWNDLTVNHLFVHSVFKVKFLTLDAGFLATRYSYKGQHYDNIQNQLGESMKDNGLVLRPTAGAGISIDFKHVRLFVGYKISFLHANVVIVL